jgi:hypothetical protein
VTMETPVPTILAMLLLELLLVLTPLFNATTLTNVHLKLATQTTESATPTQ